MAQGRYTDEEIELIKNTFGENDTPLKVIRKIFYQIPLNDSEEQIRESLSAPHVMRVIRKVFLPEITGEEPINQVVDWWYTLKVRDFTPEQASCYLGTRQVSIDYMHHQLEVLEGRRERGQIDFGSLIDHKIKDERDRYINFLARNEIIEQTEGCLFQMMILAENKGAEEILKAMKQNSNK